MNRKPMFRAGGTGLGASANLAAAGPSVLLADVSEFQPDINDAMYLTWSKAVIIRALYGDQHDDAAWYGGQRRAQLHAGGAKFVGIYQYLVASQPGAAQAQAFHRLVGAIRPGEIYIADYEEGAKGVLTDWYNEMLRLYGQAIKPHLWTYTGLDFGQAQGALPVEWIAAYQAAEPTSPHRLWQFTDSYNVPGVGRVDCSVYHGTIDELAALAYQPGKPKNWTYAAPSDLRVIAAGPHSVKLAWGEPAGAPVPSANYALFIYEGVVCDIHTIVAGYPRPDLGPVTEYQGGSLKPATRYTAHLVAEGPHGTRIGDNVFASVTFTTGNG